MERFLWKKLDLTVRKFANTKERARELAISKVGDCLIEQKWGGVQKPKNQKRAVKSAHKNSKKDR